MLLVLDVGNTNIHLGVFSDEGLQAAWDVSNDRDRTADELGMLLLHLLRERKVDVRTIGGVAVACVVPTVIATVEKAVERYFGHRPFFVEPKNSRELLGSFDDPDEVGADRIANAVAGFSKYGGPLIVVDFGTATTFDAVSSEGTYLGGAIAPGISISLEALFRRAARLPRIELSRPPKAVASNTITSMQSGIVYGYAGLVDSLVRRIRDEIGRDAGVVATGGMAALIVREVGLVGEIDEHLTLEGIRILYRRRAASR